jgi:hypothetical protein
MQVQGSITRDAPTRHLAANVPHGLFGRIAMRFALRSLTGAADARKLADALVPRYSVV